MSLVYITPSQYDHPPSLPDHIVYDDSDGTTAYASRSPQELRMLLEDDGELEVLFEATRGCFVPIPVAWIGDGLPIEGSPRVLSLIKR